MRRMPQPFDSSDLPVVTHHQQGDDMTTEMTYKPNDYTLHPMSMSVLGLIICAHSYQTYMNRIKQLADTATKNHKNKIYTVEPLQMKKAPQMQSLFNQGEKVTTQHPLDFVLWQGVRSAESVAYGLYVRIRASQQRR